MSLAGRSWERTSQFDPRIHKYGPPGPGEAAGQHVQESPRGSAIMSSHKDCHRIQDALYRCDARPRSTERARDALRTRRRWSGTRAQLRDAPNPPASSRNNGGVLLGGNFHGQFPSLSLADYSFPCAAELADVSDAQGSRGFVNPQLQRAARLPRDRIRSELRVLIAQYHVPRRSVSENKVLAHPPAWIPSPLGQQGGPREHGDDLTPNSCAHSWRTRRPVTAISFSAPARPWISSQRVEPGRGTERAVRVRQGRVPRLESDRVLVHGYTGDGGALRSGEIVRAVERAVGPLALARLPGVLSSAGLAITWLGSCSLRRGT